MTYTNIVIGSLAWGTPVNAAFTSQDARITELEQAGGSSPAALGFLATNYDPAVATSSTVLVSGTVYMQRLDLPAAATVSLGIFNAFLAGSGLTAAQNWVGLYTSTGTRVALSADQTTAFASVGHKEVAFTAPYAAAAGTYYLAVLSNGTTPPSLLRGASSGAVSTTINRNLTVSDARWTTGPTAQTTLPASITMASRTLSGIAHWSAVA
jgi:hypothetical protein